MYIRYTDVLIRLLFSNRDKPVNTRYIAKIITNFACTSHIT